MRKIGTILGLTLLAFWLTGCGMPPALGGSDQAIPLSQIDTNIRQALPVTRKASFGRVRVVGMALQSGAEQKGLEVPVKFIFTSYEIPEGIEGLITYAATLRYDPASHRLSLGELKALRMSFGNPSLEEYISTRARKGIPNLVASAIRSIPLQTFPEDFRARKINKARIEKDRLLVDFD
jgi:hypothetical protein